MKRNFIGLAISFIQVACGGTVVAEPGASDAAGDTSGDAVGDSTPADVIGVDSNPCPSEVPAQLSGCPTAGLVCLFSGNCGGKEPHRAECSGSRQWGVTTGLCETRDGKCVCSYGAGP